MYEIESIFLNHAVYHTGYLAVKKLVSDVSTALS